MVWLVLFVFALMLIAVLIYCAGCKKYNEAKRLQSMAFSKHEAEQALIQQYKEQIKMCENQLNLLNQDLTELNNIKEKKERMIYEQENKIKDQQKRYEEQKSLYDGQLQLRQELFNEQVAAAEKESQEKIDLRTKATEQEMDNIYAAFTDFRNEMNDKKMALEAEINDVQKTLQRCRELVLIQEKEEENLNKFKIELTDDELHDIEILNQLKETLKSPIILNKLIWTTYYQKPTKELCNRIVGVDKVCGVYKIENIKTKEIYIGQSVDVANRVVDHVKYGLGIETPSTVKLYKNMQKYGVHNFTFQVLEKCPKEKLNEKERVYIAVFNSDNVGLNGTKGNKS